MLRYSLLLLCLLVSFPVHAKTVSPNCKIAYGYAPNVIPAEKQKQFYSGFQFGLKKAYQAFKPSETPCSSYSNVQITFKHGTTKNPLEALNVAKELTKESPLFIAGFPSSHEALLVAKVAKDNGMAFIIPGAVASDLANFSQNIFTTSPKRYTYGKSLLQELSKKYVGKEILIVVKNDIIFSIDILKNLQKANNELGNKVTLVPTYLDENNMIPANDLKKIKQGGIGGVYITLYPYISKLVLTQLLKELPDQSHIYVASAWSSTNLSYFKGISTKDKKRLKAFGAGIPPDNDKQLTAFIKEFEKSHDFQPGIEAVEGYEAGVYAAHVLYKAHKPTKESMLTSLHETKCVDVLTVGKICRDDEGYSTKKLRFFQLTDKGFIPES